MATSTACPACGQKVPLSSGFVGGAVTCPNPSCCKMFEVSASAAKPKASGARPELLDRLPTNFLLSPPMIAVGGVGVLLYGMVLFAVVSARRNMPEPEPEPRPSNNVAYAPVAPVSSEEPPKPVENKPTPSSTPAPVTAEAKSTGPLVKGDSPKPAPETPKTTVAVVTPKPVVPASTPAPVPAPTEEKGGSTWGPLSGDPGDSQFRIEGSALIITIPGTLHFLSPDLGTKNAPKLLTEVRGDFTAQVSVIGRILPGTDPLPNFPFTYQGAGLLVWQDENNYIRLERSSIYSAERRRLHQVLFELVRDGKVVTDTLRDARESDLTLKIERRGSEFRCSYSPDGKTWLEVKRQNVTFPAAVRVGVSAANASIKPFPARLEDFQLGGGGKPGKTP